MASLATVAGYLGQECFNSLYIDGEFVATDGGTFDTVAPASERVLHAVPRGTVADMERAIAAARAAFDDTDWGISAGSYRAGFLRALAAKLTKHKEVIAEIESVDMGKHVDDASADVDMCVGLLEENADLAEQLDAQNNREVESNELNTGYVRYEPFGVVGAITPWNYPIACVVVKLAPALAAGNTMVIKPSEYTPLSSMLLAQLCADVGFPKGVVNSVTGLGADVGASLAESPDIDMVSFTGSIPTGTSIMAAAAKNVTKPLLELGGKSAAVVFDDVDIEEVAPWLMQGFCQNAGQVCVCHTRAIVHESVKDKLVEKLSKEINLIPFAVDPHDPPRDSPHNAMGPVVSKTQYEKVMGYIEGAKQDPSCTLVTGGGRPAGLEDQPGYFVQPTIFEVNDNDAKIWKEEIFGPVLSVRTFKTEEEAVAMANDTTYGLADGVFSNDVDRAKRVAHQLRAGILYVNQCMTGVAAPGGGYKMSGIGREGGMEGLMEYLQSKSVSINTGLNRPAGYAREVVDATATARL